MCLFDLFEIQEPFERVNGRIEYRINGELSRENGPAVIYDNGLEMWYKEGVFHRADGPAIIYPNGDKFWYLNGKLHRDNAPAIQLWNGENRWYKHGNLFKVENADLYL